MTDASIHNTTHQQHRPPLRGQNRYAAFKDVRREIVPTVPTPEPQPEEKRQELFSMSITGANLIREKLMNKNPLNKPTFNEQFLIDLVFKPNDAGLRLTPEQSQLILAHIGEILKEIEIEEQRVIEEERAADSIPEAENNEANTAC